MPRMIGPPLVRIECSDGTTDTIRVFIGDIEVSHLVQRVAWELDAETRVATADIRFILATADVAGAQPEDKENDSNASSSQRDVVYP
jgi:hypothetical protein